MKHTSSRGFTLIELLVVVAIIALLSATIIGSLSGARQKARDARASSELSSMRAQAELYYNNHSFTYGATTGGCTAASLIVDSTSDSLKNLFASVAAYSTDEACDVATDAWAVSAKLSNGHFCVDSNGVARLNSTATSALDAINTTTHACKP